MKDKNCNIKKILTVKEMEDMIADPEFWEDMSNDEVDVAIIPPDPDELTDTENFEENNLDVEEMEDVAGVLEVFAPTNDDSDVSSDDEPLAVKKRKLCPNLGIPENTNKKIPKWAKSQINYNKTISVSQNNFEAVRATLYGKTAVEIFEEFLSQDLVDYIVEQSVLYASQKNCPNFLFTTAELKSFIGVLLFSGYHKLPQEDMYWQQASDAGIPLVYNAMPRRRFKEIKKFIHLVDNHLCRNTNDKMFKVRPYFDMLTQNFLKFGVFHAQLSIDEMMIRYYGKHSAKMFMRGKPIKFGYKCWCLCSSNGYLYNFEPYCGKNEAMEGPLGVRVITNLISAIPADQYENHELFFDNFFTSHDIMCKLRELKMKATGTIRENRTQKCPLVSSKTMQKEKERGYFDYKFDQTNEILVLKWNDNKPVSVATNYSYIEPIGQTRRYSRKDRKHIQIPIPYVIQEYNSHMGGVDMLDKQVSLYRIRIRSKKWWWPLFTQLLDICVVNTWRLYQIANPQENISLLDVRRKIVMAYLSKTTLSTPRRSGPQKTVLFGGRVSLDVRFDGNGHLVLPITTQRRCALCGKKTKRICKKCDIPLHDVCFAPFHTK